MVNGEVFTMYSANVDPSNGFVLEKYSEDLAFQVDRKIEIQNKHAIIKVVCGDSFIAWVSVVRLKRATYKFYLHRLGPNLIGEVISKEIYGLTGIDLDISAIECVVSTRKKTLGIFAFAQSVKQTQLSNNEALAMGFSIGLDGKVLNTFQTAIINELGVEDVVWTSAEVSENGDLCLLYKDNYFGNVLFNGRSKERSHVHLLHRKLNRTIHETLNLRTMIQEATVGMNWNGSRFEIWGYWSEWKQAGIGGHFRGMLDSVAVLESWKDTWLFETFEWRDADFKQLSGLSAIKKTTKPENYFIRHVIGLSHGGCVILSEQFYESRQMETYYVNGVPQTNSRLFYHFGDIALQYLRGDGRLDSVIMVRKSQVGSTATAYLLGFSYYVCGGSLNLVYNDDEGEINRVMHVKIDNNFVQQRDWLFRSDNIPGSIVPYEGMETDYCTLTLPIYRDKQWQWLQVISND